MGGADTPCMRLVPILLVALLLTGCHEQWGGSSWGGASASSDEEAAESNVRATIPAIEAYYMDNGGSYEGATLAALRATYDPQLPDVLIVNAGAETYCVESTVGEASYFKDGPASDIFPGHCGDPVPEVLPPPSTDYGVYDAETTIRSAIPAIEAFGADHGTYAGMTTKKLRRYDAAISPKLEVVRAAKTGYCVEATVAGETYSFRGPQGPLAVGSC